MNEVDRDRKDAALGWWTRLDAGAMSPEESQAFAQWLTESPLNKAAFDEVSRLWGDLEALRGHVHFVAGAPAAAPRRGKTAALAALAAALVALLLGGEELALALRGAERTGVGETRIVALADGSHVQMNANSAIDVAFGARERRVALLKGEAFFEVAPDAARPFTVMAGGATVTALGTAFDVAMEGGRTEVTVTEHRVRISGGGPNVVVDAGRQSAFGPGSPAAAPYPVDVDQVTAWRRGKLIFEDRPLGEVMAALGKYHRGYFFIIGETARKRRVTGVFDAVDPIAAVRTIERSLGLSAIFLSDYVVLLRG